MMTTVCPVCGGPMLKRLLDASELLAVLQHSEPHREVYRGDRTNRWFVTYGGGETTAEAVQQLVHQGLLRKVYSDCPDAYHVGRTLDMARSTFDKRNEHRVYLPD